jgi:hypothetical protein
MAERNMGTNNSSGSSGHRRGHHNKHSKGWEEAQGEFYQCQFLLQQGTAPSTEDDETDIDGHQQEDNNKGVSWESKESNEEDWKTLLPSKRAKSLGIGGLKTIFYIS